MALKCFNRTFASSPKPNLKFLNKRNKSHARRFRTIALPARRQHRCLRTHAVCIVTILPLKRRPLSNRTINQICPLRMRPRIHIRLPRNQQLARRKWELAQYRLATESIGIGAFFGRSA